AACLAELGPLVHPKEKQLVLQNRPANVAAEAPVVETRIGVRVADTRIAGNALCFLMGVEGIQVTVEDKTVGRTVERICAALGYGDELSASRTSELRLVLVRQERELRHCFGRNVNLGPGDRLVIVVDAVDNKVVVPGALTANRAARSDAHAASANY